MGLRVDDHNEPRSTPKLSLSKLPCKPKQPTEMLTPPLHPSLSIPFQWEEAPGKPRLSTNSLDLPPRLSHEDEELTIMPLPSPYVGRSMSLACTFSFRKGPVSGRGEKKRGGRSRRWSFQFAEEDMGGGGSFDFSQSLGDIFKREEKNAKIKGITRVRSFFDLSTINSNLLDIYARLKQAIPWRRRR